MALIKTPIFDKISQKLGDSCFRTRKNGSIELGKNRKPTIPQTQKQQKRQQIYKTCLQQWQALTPQQKQAYATTDLPAYQNFMRICMTLKPTYIIIINNTQNNNTLTDFQVLLSINNDPEFFEIMQNKNYIEIYAEETMDTPIQFWVEQWDQTNKNAKIWLKIPSIPANSYTYAYLVKNIARTQSLSTMDTFIFGDDFNTFDTTKWQKTANANVNINNSILTLSANAPDNGITSIPTFYAPIILQTKLLLTDPQAMINAWGLKDRQAVNVWGDLWNEYSALTVSADEYRIITSQIDWNNDMFFINSPTPNTWYINTLKWNSGGVFKWDVYGTISNFTNPDDEPTTALPIRYTTDTNGSLKVDYVFVRKYAEPEPAVTYQKY